MARWKTLKQDYIFREKHLKIRKDFVELPSGAQIKDYYVLEYPAWINVIAITKDGLFVMERQYRHGLQLEELELCAGNVEEGEMPIDAAKRELLEETGYSGGEWTLFLISSPNPSSMTNMNYTFIANGVEHTCLQNLDKTEEIEVLLMTESDLITSLRNSEITEGLMQAPLWKFFYEKMTH